MCGPNICPEHSRQVGYLLLTDQNVNGIDDWWKKHENTQN